MADIRLPREVSTLINWKAVREAFQLLPQHIAADVPAPLGRTPGQHQIIEAFEQAAATLRDGVAKTEKWKSVWFILGLVVAVVALVGTVIGATLDNSWSGVGGVLLGEGGIVACSFKFLNYLRGGEVLERFLAHSKAAFLLCRTDDHYDVVLKWFINEATRLQSGQ